MQINYKLRKLCKYLSLLLAERSLAKTTLKTIILQIRHMAFTFHTLWPGGGEGGHVAGEIS